MIKGGGDLLGNSKLLALVRHYLLLLPPPRFCEILSNHRETIFKNKVDSNTFSEISQTKIWFPVTYLQYFEQNSSNFDLLEE